MTAITNDGKIFASVLDGANNTATFSLFLIKLVKALDQVYGRYWRDGVLLLDNASFHKHDLILTLMAILRMRVLFTAPASYKAIPVERYFAVLKRGGFSNAGKTPSR